jgi:hypothetical protein
MARSPVRARTASRTSAFAAVSVLGWACASFSGPVANAQYSDHLHAQLYEPFAGQVRFAVSRPAYVAVFEVTPGGYMRMLHPMTTTQIQRRVTPGYHSLTASSLTFSRQYYSYAGYAANRWEPTYLILVAADRPLRTQRVSRGSSSLLLDFGFFRHGSAASAYAVERLAQSLVPDPDVTDWTYDTYMVWPDAYAPAIPTYRVVCADGTIRIITAGRIPSSCRQRAPVRPPPDTAGPVPPGGADSAVRPRPRPGERTPRVRPGMPERIVERERVRPREGRTERPAAAGSRRPADAGERTRPAERASARPERTRTEPQRRPATAAREPRPAAGDRPSPRPTRERERRPQS